MADIFEEVFCVPEIEKMTENHCLRNDNYTTLEWPLSNEKSAKGGQMMEPMTCWVIGKARISSLFGKHFLNMRSP